jgi:hypothetical protein
MEFAHMWSKENRMLDLRHERESNWHERLFLHWKRRNHKRWGKSCINIHSGFPFLGVFPENRIVQMAMFARIFITESYKILKYLKVGRYPSIKSID